MQRREQNEEEDVKEYIRKNSVILEIFSSELLDFLADYYRPVLLKLQEHELVLLILISGMARIPIMPQTRELLNERLILDEQFTFRKGLQTLFDIQYRSEFTTYLARKQGIRICEIQEFREEMQKEKRFDEDKSVCSAEECYENYCRIVQQLLLPDRPPHTFIEDYEWYHELRTKIDGGLYPKRRNKFTQCIQIKTKNYFVTDNRKCMHFRITAMLARHNEDETVALCWKDILKYPCMEELQIEKRMLQYNQSEAFLENYQKLKCRVLRAIWLTDWHILCKNKKLSDREGDLTSERLDIWKEQTTKIIDFVGAIPLQMRYDRLVESEVRYIIYRNMHRLSEATKRIRSRWFCEKFSKYAFSLANMECPGCLEEDIDELNPAMWKQGNIYEQLDVSTGDMRMHRYFLYEGMEAKYIGNVYDEPERKQLKMEFEEQLKKDVEKIVRYWFLRNIQLTRAILNEY